MDLYKELVLNLKMPYIPPSLRDKSEEAIKVVSEGKDNHFPVLPGFKPVVSANGQSYAEKAKEWEANRKALEIKEVIDAEVARVMAERQKLEDLEVQKIVRHTKKEKVVEVQEEKEVQVEKVPEDEWILVQKKVRKPKKEKAPLTEEEFNYDDLAEDQEEFVPS
jgi:hypothetical protein